ncbi:hypothetical protein ACP4TB_28810 [Streptomyces sp. DR3-1]|uniref:hypothetical protein n=1 Tax=Streptomyces TaxID=1883 RepID=UPI00204486C2|nr:hypothetical protein [Streptomyces sp. DR3-1]MCM3822272.1 hypothetical protein [Streptomyces sp. DR3-1]
MTVPPEPLSRLALNALRADLEERERRIIDGMLQQPDYPPLPPCPSCESATEAVSSEQPFGDALLLISFAPCGHRFQASLLED